jgi:TRAP-type C4-dicarboxylate transport system permease small subunit
MLVTGRNLRLIGSHIRRYSQLIDRIEKYISRIVNFFIVFQGIGLVILIGLEVFFRYIINRALSWPEEVAIIFFVWFTLLGVVSGVRDDDHITFFYLKRHAPPLVGKIIVLSCMLMIEVYAFFMIYYGYSYAGLFAYETTPAAGINLLWQTVSLPICGFLIFFFILLKIVRMFKPQKRSGV